ncbi:hypothetical protein [Symmachiella dynata]|uniref:hypothetical protein n=1 Tax=Symmachiella dynata TaxID=2527995 RepID=UPI0030EB50ED
MIATLHELIPASIKAIPSLFWLTPDALLGCLTAQGVEFEVHQIVDSEWDLVSSSLSDDEIFELVHLEDAQHRGECFLVPEACTRHNLSEFKCHSSDLKRFIHDFDISCFFDGDTIIACRESRTLTIVHHEGVYVHVRIP